MFDRQPTRRGFLRASALAGASLPMAQVALAQQPAGDPGAPFTYEVQRTEAEWRAPLNPDEYAILREGDTEWPASSPLWNDYGAGDFDCRGCALHLYNSDWRAVIEQGFVFFYHSEPNAVLTGVERGNPYSMDKTPNQTLIEVHCRRCGSHLGHLVYVESKLVHCINGTSLEFRPAAA